MSTATDCPCRNVVLRSPTGANVRPRLRTYRQGDYMITEGQWIDPKLGQCFKQGIISREKIIEEQTEESQSE